MLRSSKSSVRSTAAGHVDENSSAHVARSAAAIWTLILYIAGFGYNNSVNLQTDDVARVTWALLFL